MKKYKIYIKRKNTGFEWIYNLSLYEAQIKLNELKMKGKIARILKQ